MSTVLLLRSATYKLSRPSTASEIGMIGGPPPFSKRAYFALMKSKMCTALAPGSATKILWFESVVTADGECSTSTRGSGGLGPAIMSSVRFRIGCSRLTSSAEENARTKVRDGDACWTAVCAGGEEVANVVSPIAAGLGTMQPMRRTQTLRRMDFPTDTKFTLFRFHGKS